eukprot:EG_transcript_15205
MSLHTPQAMPPSVPCADVIARSTVRQGRGGWPAARPPLLALLLALLWSPVSPWQGPVAIVSTMSYDSVEQMKTNKLWWCAWLNHRQYCDLHGYECFAVVDSHGGPPRRDSSPWHRIYHNNPWGFAPHWFKVFVMRALLPKFAAIVYFDNDALVENISLPIENLLGTSGDRWWVMELSKGITSHTIILKNTPRSRAMLDHLWDLRTVCPACPSGEQCAMHLLIHELLIEWAWYRGQTQVWVHTDNGKPCCAPTEHCRFPTGLLADNNSAASPAVQGCTWSWWAALNPVRLMLTHRHIHWVPPPSNARSTLNVRHPIKQMESCKYHNPSYNAAAPVDPGRIHTTAFLRQMERRPNYWLFDRPSRFPMQLRTAEIYPGLNMTGHRPRQDFRLCQIVRVP